MNTLRIGLSVVAIVLLLAGFIASTQASFSGQAQEYALKADSAPIRMLALLFLVAAVVLSFIPERGDKA